MKIKDKKITKNKVKTIIIKNRVGRVKKSKRNNLRKNKSIRIKIF